MVPFLDFDESHFPETHPSRADTPLTVSCSKQQKARRQQPLMVNWCLWTFRFPIQNTLPIYSTKHKIILLSHCIKESIITKRASRFAGMAEGSL